LAERVTGLSFPKPWKNLWEPPILKTVISSAPEKKGIVMYNKVFLSIITAVLLSAPAQQALAQAPVTSQPTVVENAEAKSEAKSAKEEAAASKQEAKAAKSEAKAAKTEAKQAAKAAKEAGVNQTEQERLDTKTINASNQIDGQKIDPKVMKKKKKGMGLQALNPFAWLLKPVTDTQKTVIELQKQIVRLEAPIANLQKPMVGLRDDMQQVDATMDEVNAKMTTMHGDINNIHTGMNSVDKRIAHMERQLGQMYEPIVELKNPVIALKDPVTGVGDQLTTLKSDLKELKQVVSFTTTAILAAVLITGVLIVIGTPIAAIFVWRHRRWIMQKIGREDVSGKAEPTSETPEDEAKALAKKEEQSEKRRAA
jgi:chromosome segregation ATPase